MISAGPEMPISDAREHLADVVNQAAYSGRITYVTRRGKRMAMILPVNHAAAAQAREAAEAAKAHEEAIVEVCRQMWRTFADDKAMRARVRASIDQMLATAEDASDTAAIDAALAELDAGAETIPAGELHAELDL